MVVWMVTAIIGFVGGLVSIVIMAFPKAWHFVWPVSLAGMAGAILAGIFFAVVRDTGLVALRERDIFIAAIIGAFITSALTRYAVWLEQKRIITTKSKKSIR